MPAKNSRNQTKDKTAPHFWRRFIQITLILVIVVAVYVLALQFVAKKSPLSETDQAKFLEAIQTQRENNRLIIPKLSVNAEIDSGDWRVLDENKVWHRWPERGNPATGGNFILAAHRYVFAWLPQKVSEASLLYNINYLEPGDKLYVDWHGQRYNYTVDKKETVNPSDDQIEAPTSEPRLTLYSCTLSGERDGREVITAKPL